MRPYCRYSPGLSYGGPAEPAAAVIGIRVAVSGSNLEGGRVRTGVALAPGQRVKPSPSLSTLRWSPPGAYIAVELRARRAGHWAGWGVATGAYLRHTPFLATFASLPLDRATTFASPSRNSRFTNCGECWSRRTCLGVQRYRYRTSAVAYLQLQAHRSCMMRCTAFPNPFATRRTDRPRLTCSCVTAHFRVQGGMCRSDWQREGRGAVAAGMLARVSR
ncbi:hypothetical protein GQ53DRAFT_242997 [Thozetella sp. PMI_491]|nr:hypothetical protein GQ53DRAFT_242997 [Thozetella sp. PMI_491]